MFIIIMFYDSNLKCYAHTLREIIDVDGVSSSTTNFSYSEVSTFVLAKAWFDCLFL
jgi:hypothetical protein